MENIALWTGFALGIGVLLALDMGVFNRKAHAPSLREATAWSIVWAVLAMAFAGWVFYDRGTKTGMEFLAGYVVELSLSVDNVFLFAVIFSYFQVPPKYQHRVLFIGILSAVVMRGVMIVAGVSLIERFHWMMYVFGAFLLYTGFKMFINRNNETDISKNPLLNWIRRCFPVTDDFVGQHFFVLREGKRYITPLLLVLIMIEVTDVLFALDSIPAVIGITQDKFVVFTSNILAILGLRSLYFLLAGVMDMFHYLNVGLAFILAFVGVKMLLPAWGIQIPIQNSLLVIVGILGIVVVASLVKKQRDHRKVAPTAGP